jgi:hypothetical protein
MPLLKQSSGGGAHPGRLLGREEGRVPSSVFASAARFLGSPRGVTIAFIAVTFLVTLAKVAPGFSLDGRNLYRTCYNFLAFRGAFFHLVQGLDLYAAYPSETQDLYKYSPAFALLMGPIALLSRLAGVFVWNLLNAAAVLAAILRLPQLDRHKRVMIAWFVLVELTTSVQSCQSNGLVAGLIILCFVCLEARRPVAAALAVIVAAFVKPFGVVALALGLLYESRARFAAWSMLWTVVLALVPLAVVSTDQLSFLYRSWFSLLSRDYSVASGLSVMGWLHAWFHLDPPKAAVVAAGALLFCAPLLRFQAYGDPRLRLQMVASVLLWVVIFNHMAESATYVIAVCGVGIWYFSQPYHRVNLVLLLFVFVCTSLSPTDVFPTAVRHQVILPFVLKAVPCILVWLKLVVEGAVLRERVPTM